MQRIESGAHFPSDVLAGAAVGIACGSLTMRLGKRKKRSSSQGHAT
ncbi:MAG: phosphatase PAP2 family protein [Planctomycetota bacterium]|nr:phosphatase PAP2 family protein [Planctomycetota bacterium]